MLLFSESSCTSMSLIVIVDAEDSLTKISCSSELQPYCEVAVTL
jgi:hypothetical protein